ncbi:hypothetical protein [Sphingobium sp. CAP-1]|uniref:hypothetical protein n=1 Tax=Sphingobium sp. CAP-1 TaxID=2676077 RepID=UPI0012BB439C|nr:hypothetical protein [Sphingobium sp. CAP-1]QGP79961.1 hypothetical protein GL174_13960 [Sphingobium sp. CAP-1]
MAVGRALDDPFGQFGGMFDRLLRRGGSGTITVGRGISACTESCAASTLTDPASRSANISAMRV